jgi:hypothetical protein
MSSTKIANLMEVPSGAIKNGLYSIVNKDIHYPTPLVDSWIKSTQPPHDSPSGLSLSLIIFVKLLYLNIERVKQKVTTIIILCSYDFTKAFSRTTIYTSRST